jgi:hypothetical protein
MRMSAASVIPSSLEVEISKGIILLDARTIGGGNSLQLRVADRDNTIFDMYYNLKFTYGVGIKPATYVAEFQYFTGRAGHKVEDYRDILELNSSGCNRALRHAQ